ncbi:hypothetical protein [Chitinimonas naiadis]
MTPRGWTLTALTVAVIGGTAWYLWPQADTTLASHAATPQTQAASQATSEAWPPRDASGNAPALEATSTVPAIDQSTPAVLSMAEAREHGDDRAPPLAHSNGDWREPPTAAELANPDRYQEYADRQQRRLYSAYVKAADTLLPQLDKDLARAKAEGGISPEEIAKVEEKRRRIAAAQAELAAKLAGG